MLILLRKEMPMNIIYVHHAERKRIDNKWSQSDDITDNGATQADLLGQALQEIKIEAIYRGEYLRYIRTADIINEYINAPVIVEPRFNEKDFVNQEDLTTFCKRNMDAIDEIVNKYRDTDANIICITSGVNLSAFIAHRLGTPPEEVKSCFAQAVLCSSIIFKY